MSIKGNWRRHGSEVVIRWCQRFFFLAASRLTVAASPLNSGKYKTWTPGPWTGSIKIWTGSMDPLIMDRVHGPPIFTI